MKKNTLFKICKGVVAISAVAGATAFAVDKVQDKKDKEEGKASALRKKGFYEANVKRPLDCALATGGLVVLSPILAITSILVKTKLGSPVIFKQKRPGRDEEIFELVKFRTMTDEKDDEGNLLPDSERLTEFGRFLRKTSIDELPELFNILKGEMAIVGPRPLLVKYLPYYTRKETERHLVRPGLTGLAQVNGRNSLSWEQKFGFDLEYIKNISVWIDINIILLTVKKAVIKPQGIELNALEDLDEYRK